MCKYIDASSTWKSGFRQTHFQDLNLRLPCFPHCNLAVISPVPTLPAMFFKSYLPTVLWIGFVMLATAVASSPTHPHVQDELSKRAVTDPYCDNAPVLIEYWFQVNRTDGSKQNVRREELLLQDPICLCVLNGKFTPASTKALIALTTTGSGLLALQNYAALAITTNQKTVPAVRYNVTACTLGTTCDKGMVRLPDCFSSRR